ncbi:hypothetical protein KQX54_001642 [Cotesia glomerata]|uniref:Uncharacterized protein n=1 Tax=Cotesia glomerata TaxID=32391 RepID=A0AAV7ISM1_COTGL|nr:hypothetical protein KQX54_001642 [Cotesia glomerata]
MSWCNIYYPARESASPTFLIGVARFRVLDRVSRPQNASPLDNAWNLRFAIRDPRYRITELNTIMGGNHEENAVHLSSAIISTTLI